MQFRYYLLIIILFLGISPQISGPTLAADQDLVIFYSNDVHGETEPCG